MDWQEIVPQILSFVAGGGLVGLFTIKQKKKKADVEVKVDEIKALHDTIDLVYKPIIDEQNNTIKRQNDRIQELDHEVKELRKQVTDERNEHQKDIAAMRSEHQKEIALMQKQILEIARTVGVKTNRQIRDDKGRFVKPEEDEA